MLQTRNGKRTAKAALKIAVDMAAEGLITQEEAVMRVDPGSLDQLLHPTIDPTPTRDVIATRPAGLAGRGHRQGRLHRRRGRAPGRRGEAVILVREETSPRTSTAWTPPRGIVTARGGMTSHAAVVARGMGRPCAPPARRFASLPSRRPPISPLILFSPARTCHGHPCQGQQLPCER